MRLDLPKGSSSAGCLLGATGAAFQDPRDFGFVNLGPDLPTFFDSVMREGRLESLEANLDCCHDAGLVMGCVAEKRLRTSHLGQIEAAEARSMMAGC